jgi:hypothetical protein
MHNAAKPLAYLLKYSFTPDTFATYFELLNDDNEIEVTIGILDYLCDKVKITSITS